MWIRKLNIEHLNLTGKRILMRVDYDITTYGWTGGKITHNKKIITSLDSIVFALVKEARSVVLMSHIGRPEGLKNIKYSLAPVAEELSLLLKQAHEDPKSLGKYSQIFKLYAGSKKFLKNVEFLSDCIGAGVQEICQNPPQGSVFLLENLKFHSEEEGVGRDTAGNKNSPSTEAVRLFRQSLRKLGDIYINDAFSVSQNHYSSVLGEGFEKRAAGLQLKKEINFFKKVLKRTSKRPALAIIGGITVVDKKDIIENLLDKVDELVLTGALAFPFLKQLHRMQTGHSLFDMEGFKFVKKLMKKAKTKRVSVHFPVDFMTSSRFGAIQLETVKSGIEDEWMGLDIGPESCAYFRKVIMRAKTIIWNGTPGAYELESFQTGTESVLFDIVKATSRGATTILLGEDTANCAVRWNQENNVSHVSSGSEAAKEVLKGNILPGVAALSDAYLAEIPDLDFQTIT